MNTADYADFEKLLAKVETLYGKELDDDAVKLYWDALKDLPLSTVERRIGECIKRCKFFPKPSEIRPREDAATFEQSDKARKDFEAAEKRCIEFWDEELRLSPIAAKWAILAAYDARTLAITRPGTPEHARRIEFATYARGKLLIESGGIQ